MKLKYKMKEGTLENVSNHKSKTLQKYQRKSPLQYKDH